MKKVRYRTDIGTLEFIVPVYVSDEQIRYECDCAYSAWLDTDPSDSSFVDLPEYVAMCLSDSGITVIAAMFEED